MAMTVSAAVATALLTLYTDLDAKLHHEFRGFGANVVVTEAAPDANFVAKAKDVAGTGVVAAAFGYAVVTTDRGTPVVVSGVAFEDVRRLDSWWQVAGWPNGTEDALLGSRAAEFVGNEKAVTLTFAGKARTFHGAGRLKTGGEEDSRIYVPAAAFMAWTGVKPNVVELQVPGGAAGVEAAMARLRVALPAAQVTPIRQLIDGESRIVDRTHALMFGAVILIALTVGISVLATLSASVLERRRDFALMKALGGREWQMTGLFLLETAVLAGAGIFMGYILGSAMAWVISEANFHTATLPRLSVLPFVVVLNVTIALLAAVLPMRALRGLEPAALLKGE